VAACGAARGTAIARPIRAAQWAIGAGAVFGPAAADDLAAEVATVDLTAVTRRLKAASRG
jgi:hypothetical protein